MALPVIATTTYTLTVPSTGQKVKYRAFLVKEQKSLLIAQQSEDPTVMVDTLKSIIHSCILDKIDVDALATFDLEFIFMQLRSRSVGEIAELLFTCEQCKTGDILVRFDVSQLKVEIPEGHTKKIQLTDDIGIVLKYPSLDILGKLQGVDSDSTDTNIIFDVIVSCIDYIYDATSVYMAKDSTKEELNTFLENLNSEQFNKIKGFFDSMPKLSQVVEYTCHACGHHNVRNLRGITNFF
jgi:DNA-directed RNA polymerase subunit M/transcription elongation factor TFIIS